MPHEIRRVLRAFANRPLFIEPRKAQEIAAMLELRAAAGPRTEPWKPAAAEQAPIAQPAGTIHVMRLHGTIMPRADMMSDISGGASLASFGAAFDRVASDSDVKGIVLDVDSPGGTVDLVPETAEKIRAARRADRPIIAVANTLAASAAYWIASAADELVVTPSGEVGSIGVYLLHQEMSAALEEMGVRATYIFEGARKVEGNPFEPLGDEARGALQAGVKYYYDLFTRDVATFRGVPISVVRADPEKDDKHFGGGRCYPARIAVDLGLADRIDTLDGTIARLQQQLSGTKGRRRSSTARRRLALI